MRLTVLVTLIVLFELSNPVLDGGVKSSAYALDGPAFAPASGYGQDLIRLAQAESAPEETPEKPAWTEYFFDDFDGDGLGKEWEVGNENPDHYIVEDGALLILSTDVGSLQAETLENLFRLKKALPKGDWLVTVKFKIDFATEVEKLSVGLYQDKDNWIAANVYSQRHSNIALSVQKMANAKATTFSRWLVYRNKDWNADRAKSLSQPQLLRIRKQGRSYLVSAKWGDQENWAELQKVTSLRAKGNLVLGLMQYKAAPGETTLTIDSVKIEVPQGSGPGSPRSPSRVPR